VAGKGFPQRRFEGFVNLKESSSSPSRNFRSRDGVPIIWLKIKKSDENKSKLRTMVRRPVEYSIRWPGQQENFVD